MLREQLEQLRLRLHDKETELEKITAILESVKKENEVRLLI